MSSKQLISRLMPWISGNYRQPMIARHVSAMCCRRPSFDRFYGTHRQQQQQQTFTAETSDASDQSSDDEYDGQQHDSSDEPIISLYDTHIPTTVTQKVLLSVGSAIAAITDPYRDDMIAVFGETTGYLALQKMHKQMLSDDEGRQILEDKPRINSTTIDIDRLATLPDGTFGRQYYNWLTINNVTPDSRQPVKFVDDVHLAYVMQRYREVHDMIHAVLGMPTNMLGEVLVKWIEAIQTDLPMCWSAGLFGAVRLAPKQRKNYVTIGLPWALKCGHEARSLICIYYEKRFEQNLDDLRRELKIPQIPKF
ncbi:ubiquinone biosynthesis protein COQ4 homolog, mitochondrial-like [Oppia nitens]|uniref:ubiquinone biosynthesis protein COQ4 homolog, mitochondrial-like n=1 Tax=Oppia nitens TaxID=1686743 RepID=UPI0023DC48A6|nr:ubiquinone biosynthesis protein COQ4 homolog, mitochondrial-like [Oppia nitens]XP_054164207.1 ubiquinone biosynthesis protein COQ4 homolog, mitochondrial-like [Oppia nitens]